MANTIKIKRSTTTATPTSLAEGELAYSENSNKLFYGDSNGNIKTIGGLASTFVPLGLPTATASVLGGIKVGNNLSISSGVLSAASSYVLPAATNSVIGGMYTGTASGINLSTSGPTSGQIFLKIATQGEKGGVRLNSATVQTVTANSVSATASRTYSLQLANAGTGQAVVNVPWTDTNTTYTAGTGLTLSGTEFSVGALAITTVQTAANETAHLALTAQEGDVVIRSDENKSYIHDGGTAGTMADYTLLSTPTSDITAVTVSGGLTGGGSSGSVGVAHQTTTGYKHVPAGGTSGQFLTNTGASGTAQWTTHSDTNTTYSAGTLLDLSSTTFNVDLTELTESSSSNIADLIPVMDDAGNMWKIEPEDINISRFNNDSAFTSNSGDITGVTAGDLLTGGGASGAVTLDVDLSGLTDGTVSINGSEDELVYLDNGSQKRKLVSEIALGAFYNNLGWTTNTGDITRVSANQGLLLTSGGGQSGDVTVGHIATNGYKHIPVDGATGQLLGYSAAGTAAWTDTIDGGTY